MGLFTTTQPLLLLLLCTLAIFRTATAESCTDNNKYTYNKDTFKTCSWVGENTSDRCGLKDQKNDVRVKNMCPRTCGSCPSKQSVGQFCVEDKDCASWTCRENACYASPQCKALKQTPMQEFDENMIIIVFVGSGFTDISSWEKHVARTFYSFNQYEFFDYGNPRYNAFYVDELEKESFCHYGCQGLDKLLCCDLTKVRELTKKCFPPGVNVNSIVIENSTKYGGAGYLYENIGTTSIHELGPKVAIHELGHSLFELADEYLTSGFTADMSPNCDVNGCEKWKDLDEQLGGGLCEMKGCKNGDYFVPGPTFMNMLDESFGEVNTRYTCCTFLVLTGGTPSYCDRFEFGAGLLEYCKHDYQHYGLPYGEDNQRSDSIVNESTGKYVLLHRPATLMVNTAANTFTYDSPMDGEGPKLVLRRKHYGDFANLDSLFHSGVSSAKKLTIEFDSGHKGFLYYRSSAWIGMPPNNGSDSNLIIDDVEVGYEFLEVVIDARNGIAIDIEFEDIEITWWTIVKHWLIERWNMFKALFGSNSKREQFLQDDFASSPLTRQR